MISAGGCSVLVESVPELRKSEKECQVSARFAVLAGQLSNLPGPSSATEIP